MTADYFETPAGTPDFKTELAHKLAEIAPELVADGKVDFEKIKELLGEDLGDERERFGLFWPGKQRALRAAQAPTTATLKPDFENSKDWDTTNNIFIEGDNLEVLKILQKHYHGKVKLIYIDPPYNTGKDFVYPDNYKEGLDSYLEWTKQVNEEGQKLSTNSESDGRYHSNWLNMMYPRLKLARNLLRSDGVMLISIDGHEIDNLRKICLEIFGENNFIADLVWVKKNKTSGVPPKNMLLPNYEYIVAVKRGGEFSFKGQERSLASYKQDSEGRWWRTMPIQATGAQNSWFTITNPINGKGYHGNWAFSEQKIAEMVAAGKIQFPKNDDGKPVQIVYADEMANDKSPIFANLGHFDSEASTKQLIALMGGKKYFDFPKPLDLLEFLIGQLTNAGDLVLDFFSGSATTAHAVMKLNAADGLNRAHIQVQLPEPLAEDSIAFQDGFSTVADISRKRIDLAGVQVSETLQGHSIDMGYRAFKLSESNFEKWRMSNDTGARKLEEHLFSLRESASSNATQADLLFELLLKQGYSLTEKIATVQLSGREVQSVADGLVLGYLDEHAKPTLEQFRELVASDPVRVVVLEDAFQGDDELKTNLVQLCKSKNIELWTA